MAVAEQAADERSARNKPANKEGPRSGGPRPVSLLYSCSQSRALRAGMATRTHWLCTLIRALLSSTSR